MEDTFVPKPYVIAGSLTPPLPNQSPIILPIHHDHYHVLHDMTGEYRAHIYEKKKKLWVSLARIETPCVYRDQCQCTSQFKRSVAQLYKAKQDAHVLAIIERLLNMGKLPYELEDTEMDLS
jgi:hypothetical protein